MALYNFHRVLMTAAILFCFGFALWAYRQAGVVEGSSNMIMAWVSGLISIGIVAYLIHFNSKLRILRQPRQDQTPTHT